jgi:hypothetical protein
MYPIRPIRTRLLSLIVPSALVATLALPAAASAQAMRTWVSAEGSDGNTCSRFEPCATFPGCTPQDRREWRVNALSPGGYGRLRSTGR